MSPQDVVNLGRARNVRSGLSRRKRQNSESRRVRSPGVKSRKRLPTVGASAMPRAALASTRPIGC